MTVLIVQLSDIHFRKSSNLILTRVQEIIAVFQNSASTADMVFLTFTGDLTSSGNPEEILVATKLIQAFREELQKNPRISFEVLVIPGNHDCDFTRETAVRRTLVDDIISNWPQAEIDEDVIAKCTSIQEDFLHFKSCNENPSQVVYQHPIVTVHSFLIGKSTVVFRCLNTAWISKLKEKPGTLVFPCKYVPDWSVTPKADINITLAHHTLNWFKPDHQREFRAVLEKYSDIIITGHEHISDRSQRNDFGSEVKIYIEGGVLQEQDSEEIGSFNCVEVKLEVPDRLQFTITEFVWNGQRFVENIPKKAVSETKNFIHANARELQINQDFDSFLNDPGANFTHPRVPKLLLPDIFVYPNVRIFECNPRKTQPRVSETRCSDTIVRFDQETRNRIVVFGPEKSGRSSLAKTLFRWSYENDMVPIWMDGSEINFVSKTDLLKKTARLLRDQYKGNDETSFSQLSDRKKVIIIDSIENARIARKYRPRFLQSILSVYDHVIITASDLLEIEELSATDGGEKSIFELFEIYRLLEFGHVLRDKLIRRWISLGGEDLTQDTNEFYQRLDQAKVVIDTVIGSNFVPSYPFFLLALLQTYETFSSHDLRHSSYGYYYEYLITGALQQINVRPEQIDAYRNYLSELAYFMFCKNIDRIIFEDLLGFESQYAEEYGLPDQTQKLREKLIDANLLGTFHDEILFRYRYIFYFFIARYLSSHLQEPSVQQKIEIMTSHPHVRLYANVLMLLTYLSRDEFIINNILRTAQQLFRGIQETRLESDIGFLNQLIGAMPKLVLEAIKTEESRERALQTQDRDEENFSPELDQDTLRENLTEISDLDVIAKFNLCFKLSEILGQIAKNYYGSLKQSRKIEIVKECLDIMLRTLSVFFTILRENKDQIVVEIVAILRQHNMTERDDHERIIGFTQSFIFQISAAVSFAFISRISRFVGTKNLAPVFQEILRMNDITSVKLVDKAIKLDHFRGFPIGDLSKLNREISDNLLASTVLRAIVVNHLYMFDVDFKDRQKICQEFQISIADSRIIDHQSREKKTQKK